MDTLETIKCPACGKDMEKIFIPAEGINIDICLNGCGGIFFDNREFEAFNEAHEDVSCIEEQLKNKTFEPVADNKIRKCPACGANMVKNTSAVKSSVIVDDCYICGGKFLDHNELFKIREEFGTDKERENAAMAYLFNEIGEELSEVNKETAKRKINKSIGQKLFYSLLNIKQ